MQRIPNGRYTRSQNIIFGAGQLPGINAWYLLGHTSDAKLKKSMSHSKDHQRDGHIVDVRICVENISQKQVLWNINNHESIRVLPLPDDTHSTSERTTPLEVLSTKIVAWNGEDPEKVQPRLKDNKHELDLHMNDFVLVSCKILCPENIINEPDFLSMLESIQLTLHFPNNNNNINNNTDNNLKSMGDTSLVLHPREENFIWKHYVTLPNGVTLLKDKATTGM